MNSKQHEGIDKSKESVETPSLKESPISMDASIPSTPDFEKQNLKDTETARRIEELRAQIAQVYKENPDFVERKKFVAAIADLQSAYFYLLTQPYSIKRFRDTQYEVKVEFARLVQIVGEERATKEFEDIKKKFPGEPRVRYINKWAEVKDRVMTRISDLFDGK